MSRLHMFGLLTAAVLVVGCGQSKGGKVKGQVVYKDQPVAGGSVNFLSRETGSAAIAKIESSGEFTLADPLPAGTYTVYVTPTAAEPAAPGTRVMAAKGPAIPVKARDPGTSGVTVTVKPGENPPMTILLTD